MTFNREEEMFFLSLVCLIFSLLWGMLNGQNQQPRSADLPRLCLPNCFCGKYTADCILTFCEQEYETTSAVLILKGGMCYDQWDRLRDLPSNTRLELHNAKCPHGLDHCE